MKAGFARSVITPPLPVQLAGHRGPRVARGIGDDLYTRAIVIEYRDTRFAIVSNDLLWLSRRQVSRIRELISRSAAVRPDNVLVACTHTHSGPDTLGWYTFAPSIPEYWLEALSQTIASNVFLASERLESAYSTLGRQTFPFAVNRRRPVGREIYREPYFDGPTDKTLTAMCFHGAKGILGGIIHAAMHPVILGAESLVVSGDWCGRMISTVERELGAVWLFLNGAAGDSNPRVWTGQSYATMLAVGDEAANCAIEAVAAGSGIPMQPSQITCRSTIGLFQSRQHPYLQVEQARRQAEDGGLAIECQAILLGDVIIVGVAGECLYAGGRHLQCKWPRDVDCLVVSYANDYVGYLPMSQEYNDGGYEPAATMLTASGSQSYFASAERLIQAFLP